MRLMVVMLILALSGLHYKLWLGDGNLWQWKQLEKKIAIQKEKNEALKSRNHALEADIVELQGGDQALEEQARYELGMIKKGETYYQFVE